MDATIRPGRRDEKSFQRMQPIGRAYTCSMRLRRLDLNLLLALDVLLSTRSVTVAANRLHVTQPSMSGSLARLREHFGDQLLVKVGRKLELTPLGETLMEPVHELIEKMETTISLRSGFDPLTDRRHFSICASDGTVLTLLVDVLREVETRAPGVSIELLPADPSVMVERLNRRELDLIFTVERFAALAHPSALVIEDEFLCVVWEGNTRVKRSLTMEHFLSLGHAITRYGFDRRPGFEQYMLEAIGVKHRVDVTCTTPALLGHLVVGTQRIATLPSRMARLQARVLPLKLFKPPVQIPPLRIVMQWHRTREHDGATSWLRNIVMTAASASATD